MKNKPHSANTAVIRKRGDTFADRAATKIVNEQADPDNPFLAERVLWHGYDVLELMRHRSLTEVIFLLLKGELPTPIEARQLEQILVALANPGPRHASTRAVMNASVSRTDTVHLLPIGLALMGGENQGAAEVRDSIKFFRKNLRADPVELAGALRAGLESQDWTKDGDITIAAGFGSRFAAYDKYARSIAEQMLASFPDNEALTWGMQFSLALESLPAGWLMTGVAAAMFVELGFTPNVGAGLFQMAACPGLLAHGIEMSGKPITAMPFVADEKYHFQTDD